LFILAQFAGGLTAVAVASWLWAGKGVDKGPKL
jgi:hypothetical protein